jgi:hypothetical protein
MILIDQNESSVFLGDSYSISIESSKKNDIFSIILMTNNNHRLVMANYEKNAIAKIALKKFIDAKLRGDKIFKFFMPKIQDKNNKK